MPKDKDPESHLSPAGRREAEKTGRFLRMVKVNVATIYHSPKTRAKETSEIIAEGVGVKRLVEDVNLTPHGDTQHWAYSLSQSEEDVILVGHLPHLERLSNLLLSGGPENLRLDIKAAGAVCLERLPGNGWNLLWMIEPGLVLSD